MQLDGKRALITGAGSGIGRALAIEASRRGVQLCLTGRRRDALKETCSELTGTGHLIVAGDVTHATDRHSILSSIESAWGGLDLLINNAGLVEVGPLAETTDDRLQEVINTNLLAPMALVRDTLPLMQAERSRIINIGSMLGDIPYPLFAAYSATKAGLRGFSIALRRELAPAGIGVTYVTPRATRTAAARSMAELTEPFRMTFDTPTAVANFVWNGVERNADHIFPGRAERVFLLLQNLAPRLVDRFVAKQLSRVKSARTQIESLFQQGSTP